MKRFKNFELLDEIPSTNSYLQELLQKNPTLPELYGVFTRHQSQGRGQRGNTWHSKPGENIIISFLLRPQFLESNEQFVISELASIAVARCLAQFLDEDQKKQITVKWPNDIYYGDKKIAGILIEHSLTGNTIDYSIIGLGININERDFPEDLPNPVSLTQITGKQYELAEVIVFLLHEIQEQYQAIRKGLRTDLHARYMKHLYRRDGQFYPYESAQGIFKARIRNVQPNGIITLCHEDGELHDYAFKELKFL